MKRAFTLIEMMIVVAVLVILMTITFKLMGLGTDSERRTRTVTRLQRLENCLSGYYAAFGSYPPVKLHGNRDIYVKRDGDIQDEDGDRNENIWNWTKIYQKEELDAWNQVELACRAQPIACRYPFPHDARWDNYVKRVCENMKSYVDSLGFEDMDPTARSQIMGGFDSIGGNPGRINSYRDETDWNKVQVFQFGLMSYLLPRYLVMMSGDEQFYTHFAQWTENNKAPRDPFRGGTAANQNWGTVWRQAEQARRGRPRDVAQLANIPSQAACARWLPNLEKMCACNMPEGDISTKPFGVNLKSDNGEGHPWDPDLYGEERWSMPASPAASGGGGSS